MAEANVRRRGTGDPEAPLESRIGEAPRASNLWATRRRGRQKFRHSHDDLVTPQAFADPRLAFALARKPNAQHLMPQRGVARRHNRARIGRAQRASNLWATHRRGRQKFRRFSEDLVTPQAFADPRLAFALARKPKAQPLMPQREVARARRASLAKSPPTRRDRPRSSRERGSSSGRGDRRRPSRIPSAAPGPRSRQTPPAARSERPGANRASAGDIARG